jgi:hypothetical protein
VQEHIGVAVAEKTDRRWDINPADNKLSAFQELVNVYADSYAHGVVVVFGFG